MDRLTFDARLFPGDRGGQLRRAARELNLSPAVVTRLVADLEEHLGARLLNRTTRRLSLTDTGEMYLERVRHVLTEVEEAEALATALERRAARPAARALPAGLRRAPARQAPEDVPGALSARLARALGARRRSETVDENFDVDHPHRRPAPARGRLRRPPPGRARR